MSRSQLWWILTFPYSNESESTLGEVLATVDIYDVTTGVWSSTATGAGSLSDARELLVGAGANNVIVFAGGAYVSFAVLLCLTPSKRRTRGFQWMGQCH